MSAHGSSDRIRFLRETLAGLEQAGGSLASPASLSQTPFGREGVPCALDRALGGLFSGALYEAAPARMGDHAAASGFAFGVGARLAAKTQAPLIFISDEFSTRETGAPYGLGLAAHGLDLTRLVYVRSTGAQDLLWALEESLRAKAAACVVADLGSAARAFDLVAARRITMAARMSGTSAVLLHPPASFNRPMAQNGARMRFEIRSARSAEPQNHRRPVPDQAHFGVRFAKPGIEAGKMRGLDTQNFKTLIWDHEHGHFRDTLSLALSATPAAGAQRTVA